ncbi:uncharacterized protein BP5553_00510 [Venustampulla echinocandica]|uniref:TPR-like protein n=1 Tax=Venustampulla echinocandica TaxID=2656787 RepID=A0A370TYD2_9HELO|nr:uncharacterized protein BP5553_00510 [Venustampulla echinocandica]RDL40531.1 hypothetical protein BP5553_00510 [Venustampulla echinocandica]
MRPILPHPAPRANDTPQSQYPDPELSQLQNPPWSSQYQLYGGGREQAVRAPGWGDFHRRYSTSQRGETSHHDTPPGSHSIPPGPTGLPSGFNTPTFADPNTPIVTSEAGRALSNVDAAHVPPRVLDWLQSDSPHLHEHTPSSDHITPPMPSFEIDPNLDTSRAEFAIHTSEQRTRSRESSVVADFANQERQDSDGYISDADSEYLDHTGKMEKLKNDVINLNDRDSGDESLSQSRQPIGRRGTRGRGRGTFRGPRRAAEPTGDVKLRLSQASQYFIEEKYPESRALVHEVIRINAETYEAWTLLASIFKEEGDINSAVYGLMFAAHLRPKHLSAWFNCARFALEETGDLRPFYLRSAQFCYAAAVRADYKSLEAHFGKAEVFLEQEKYKGAISEYQTILKLNPHNIAALRKLAEACMGAEAVDVAKDRYKESIAYIRTSPDKFDQSFGWEDVYVYVELFAFVGQYGEAIRELKTLSRWLLGREDEYYWDSITADDCEFDVDNSRRLAISDFAVDKFPLETYGMSLPLELRVQLGFYRLRLGDQDEAMRHLEYLDPSNTTGEDIALNNPFLYLNTANQLFEANLFKDALRFYEPLKEIPEEITTSLYTQMGLCFLGENQREEAETHLKMAAEMDESNEDARMHLAKLYEQQKRPQQALEVVNEVISIKRKKNSELVRKSTSKDKQALAGQFRKPPKDRRAYRTSTRPLADERVKAQTEKAQHLQTQYYIMKSMLDPMREGDVEAMHQWMNAARDLTEDFRQLKSFYPWDKYIQFQEYRDAERVQAMTALDSDLSSMAERLARSFETNRTDKDEMVQPKVVPTEYRGISFQSWLDILMEYAICNARNGNTRESYEVCNAAKDAIIYYHSPEDMFLIHLCWCMCALISSDEETVVSMARFFMRDYQFTTDSYRLFGVLTRMCQSPVSWYCAGPTQKFVLRQIKAMDYALMDEETRNEKYFHEKGSYSTLDKHGRPIMNDDLDISLLMLYGYILFVGSSYAYAINYFLRAHALDPDNPMINLSIGLAYLHHALKRQAENRQYGILQGLTFILRYYDARKKSDLIEERLEAHHNLARAYHILGLPHLAIPYYWKVLQEHKGDTKENLVIETAYNLQTLYTMSGNPEMAQSVTKEWLVI